MKKIIFFHPSSDLYGSDKILIYVMKNYEGFHKTLILKSNGPLVDLIREEIPEVEIKIFPFLPIIARNHLNFKGILNFLVSIFIFFIKTKSIRNDENDVIYLNTLAVLPMLFYFTKTKKITHIHEILNNRRFIHRMINKIAIVKSDLLICVSKAVKSNMELASISNREKIKLVYNGISFDENLNSAPTPFIIDKNKINFCLIGRIKPSHKGHNLLVDAISELSVTSLNNSHFYFVGSTVKGQENILDDLKSKIHELNLENNITILSFVKNIDIIYKNIDVAIVPSVFDDPFPTTVLEAMFFCKPVIGTNVGGIPEMISDKETGFIVKRDCSKELSQKIYYFIQNQNKIEEFGKLGRIKFNSNFSKKSFDKNYRNLLNKYIFNF